MRMKKILTFLMTFAMVVSLLPATAFAANNTATTMRLAKTQGTVTVTNATGKNVKQTGNMKLYNGYKVKTGAKSYAWVSLDDTKVAKLDANSVMEVQKQGKSLTLYLSSGNMFFNVKDPLKSGETFSIKTSTMTTGIRGTSGCVRVISPRVTEIHLLTGEVQVYAEHPVLGLSKTATLKAGQKATSLIDWEAIAATGEMVEILIERLENHEICGVCSKEIANDPALLERIEREAPHLLPEKAAAEADERLAADEAKAEEKQAAIDKAVAEQVFPEDVDPYFEEKEGGGGGGGAAASKIVNVATWGELLQAIADYNGGSGTTQINLTATIDARNEQQTLLPIENKGALTLNLGENELFLNGTLFNEGNLTITNVDGYIYGNGIVPAVQNDNILTLLDGQIDGNGQTALVNNAGTFYMRGGELVASPQSAVPALDNDTGARVYLYGGTVWSGAETVTGMVGANNRGHLTISGATLKNLDEGVANMGTVSMTSGLIESSGTGVDNQGNFRITGGKIAVTGTDAIGIRMITNDPNVMTTVMDDAVITATGGYGIYAGQGAEGVLDVSGGTVSGENANTIAIQINSAAVSVSIGAAALVRAKGENTVLVTAADEQWPDRCRLRDDRANSGYWFLYIEKLPGGDPGTPPVENPDVVTDPIDTWAALVQAVADFNQLTDDGSTMTIVLGGNIPAEGETSLAAMDPIASGNKHLVINMNNHSLTLPQTITVNGNLNIIGGGTIDSTVTGQGTPLFDVGSTGSITLDKNTTTSKAPTIDVAMNQTAIRGTQAGIYMNAGQIQLGDVPSTAIYADGGSVEMSGGEILIMACGDNWANMGIQTTNNATVKVTGGTIREGDGIKDANNDNNYAIYAGGGTVELTSGAVSVHNGVAVYVSDVSKLTLGSTAVTGKIANKLLAVPDGSLKTGYTEKADDTGYFRLQKTTTVSSAVELVQAVAAFDGSAPQEIKLTQGQDLTIDAGTVEAAGTAFTLDDENLGNSPLTIDLQGVQLSLATPLTNKGNLIITDNISGGTIVGVPVEGLNSMIVNSGTLTLNSGIIEVPHHLPGLIALDNSGTFNMNGGRMNVIYTTGIRNSGEVNLNAGQIIMPSAGGPELLETDPIAYQAYQTATENGNAVLNLNGTTITMEDGIAYEDADEFGMTVPSPACAIFNDTGNTVNVTAGTLNVNSDLGICNRGTLDISGGTMNVNADSGENVKGIENFGTFDFEGGTITVNGYGVGVYNGNGGTMNANLGTITVKATTAVGIENDNVTNLQGTTIEARFNDGSGGTGVSSSGTLKMTAGTVWADCMPGISVTGGTFQMTGGSIQSKTINYGGIDLSGGTATLSGGTITVTGSYANERGVMVREGAALIVDGVTINATGYSTYSATSKTIGIYHTGGSVTINSGTITANVGAVDADTGESNTYALYSNANWAGGLTIAPHAELDRPAATIRANVMRLDCILNPVPVVEGTEYTAAEEMVNDAATGYWFLCYPN